MNAVKQLSVYRHELKYFMNYAEYIKLRDILSRFMKADEYVCADNGYFIRSLYFDTPQNKEYIEKVTGMEVRKKIRLRIYSLEDEAVKLEIKAKYNNYMKKDTAIITRENARRLARGDKSFLLDFHNVTMNRVYYYMSEMYYMPVVVIDYNREAFICDYNNIRITFDTNISSCSSELDLFSDDLHFVRVFDQSTIVMEVKYNRFLPKWLKMILSCTNIMSSAISKYCYGRQASEFHL
jgi:hypothetical protein